MFIDNVVAITFACRLAGYEGKLNDGDSGVDGIVGEWPDLWFRTSYYTAMILPLKI